MEPIPQAIKEALKALGKAMSTVEREASHAPWKASGRVHGDPATHGIAMQIGALDAKRIEHGDDVLRPLVIVEFARMMRLAAFAMAAGVEGNQTPAEHGEA